MKYDMVKYLGFANSPLPFFCMLLMKGKKRWSLRLVSVSSGAVVIVLLTYKMQALATYKNIAIHFSTPLPVFR
jgi:hypothetical protein